MITEKCKSRAQPLQPPVFFAPPAPTPVPSVLTKFQTDPTTVRPVFGGCKHKSRISRISRFVGLTNRHNGGCHTEADLLDGAKKQKTPKWHGKRKQKISTCPSRPRHPISSEWSSPGTARTRTRALECATAIPDHSASLGDNSGRSEINVPLHRIPPYSIFII